MYVLCTLHTSLGNCNLRCAPQLGHQSHGDRRLGILRNDGRNCTAYLQSTLHYTSFRSVDGVRRTHNVYQVVVKRKSNHYLLFLFSFHALNGDEKISHHQTIRRFLLFVVVWVFSLRICILTLTGGDGGDDQLTVHSVAMFELKFY